MVDLGEEPDLSLSWVPPEEPRSGSFGGTQLRFLAEPRAGFLTTRNPARELMVGLSGSFAGSEMIDEHVRKLIKGHSRLHILSLPFYILARAPLGLEFHRTQLAAEF
ncbi:hypothetical protein SLEP1_g6758 [Rubroshorea leprosula]|uniref:Uncharacterized protein n=1 Tax=Rubroshorea leprosula TaxID=152421 RepID=A0AAV5I577_9ROSI|nr:hypothetical protein SLEP1_g6758 [Rubroshorea leprosula]